MRTAGIVAGMGEKRGLCRIVVGEPERKRLLDRPRHRYEDNVKIGLSEMGWEASTRMMWLKTGTGGRLM
jgi:hypothetical protein